MSEITLEKTHALLEKLAEYVMTKIPQLEAELAQKADKTDILQINSDMINIKSDVHRLEQKVDILLDGMDAQAKRLDIISIDMKAISRTLDVHEERLGALEEKVFGYRVREEDIQYKNNSTSDNDR